MRRRFPCTRDHSPHGLDQAAEDFFLRQEFQLNYQPVLGLDRSEIGSFEALLHRRQPQQQTYPADYIALLERTSLRAPLTRWILQEASQQVQAWHHHGHLANLSVSVNLSTRQLRQGLTLVQQIETVLTETGIVPSALRLEIPGTATATAPPLAKTLTSLKQLGLQLYLDNFSPESHSLEVLQQLPLDAVKLAQTPTPESSHPAEALRTTLHIADELGVQVIAKRIETPAQLEKLRDWGIRYGQGFLLAHPLPSQEATQLAITPHPIQEFRLPTYLTALNHLSQFLWQYLGQIAVNYWQRTKPNQAWLRSLTPLASGELTLTGPAPPLIDLQQQQALHQWVQGCLDKCHRVLPALPNMLRHSTLTLPERQLLKLDASR